MKKTKNTYDFIISLLLTFIAVLFMGYIGDYFFDLNDDVLMKDMLSGAYTGAPEAHNIQMLYPISAFISMFYRVVRGFDWYGFFLCTCQYLCVFLISYKALKLSRKDEHKVLTALFVLVFSLGVIGAHFLFVQYTFTCGFLSATAAFLILTHKKDADHNFGIAFWLILTAFLLRSEMLLLTFPLVCVAIFIRWMLNMNKEEFFDCLKLFGIIVAALALALGIHRFAFSLPEWKEYSDIFDARTELYDFQYVPEYEANKDFYDSLGIDKSEYRLITFENYNIGLDDEIDAKVLNEVAEYANKLRSDEEPFAERLKAAFSKYIYGLHNFSRQNTYEIDSENYCPWNLIVILLYIGVLASYIFPRQDSSQKEILRIVGALALLFICRTTLWIYIIMGRRAPIRITHPLYLIEILVLFAILLRRADKSRALPYKVVFAVMLISLLFVPDQKKVIDSEMQARELMRKHYDALYDYFAENSDNFYFIDVYTSISCENDMEEGEATFSEKLFDRVNNEYANHDLMGGWGVKSPLTIKKYSRAGYSDMQSGLLAQNAYVVQSESDEDGIGWIIDYYRDKGIEVTVDREKIIADAFAIYAVREK